MIKKKTTKHEKFSFTLAACILFICTGILICFYPYLSNLYYEKMFANDISSYSESVDSISAEDNSRMIKEARKYNEELAQNHVVLCDPFNETIVSMEDRYQNLLKTQDSGVMGYLDIPCIDTKLPIFHGTSSEVLSRGVGHLEDSSLPVGGSSTHAVLTGHTGVSSTIGQSAKLFTDLVNMEKGDYFFIYVLGEKLAYQVNDIRIVLPSNTDSLGIVDGEDLVTLVTCYPYAVNTHRLLVTGKRTAYTDESLEEAASEKRNSQWMIKWMTYLKYGFAMMGFFVFLMFAEYALSKRRRHK